MKTILICPLCGYQRVDIDPDPTCGLLLAQRIPPCPLCESVLLNKDLYLDAGSSWFEFCRRYLRDVFCMFPIAPEGGSSE